MAAKSSNRTAEPDDAYAAAWKDGEDWYSLRHTTSKQVPEATSADSPVRLIHEGGTLSAVWAIGNNAIHPRTLIPLQRARPSKFVQEKAFQVPVPEVIYSWVDRNRSFLVLKRVPGITLRDAWGTMSVGEQDSTLDEVVHMCDVLASITSDRLENVHGGPVPEPYLAHSERDSLEPLSVFECESYFFRENLHPNPEIEERFHLYHPDLGPGNILLSNQKLSIIDCECAGF